MPDPIYRLKMIEGQADTIPSTSSADRTAPEPARTPAPAPASVEPCPAADLTPDKAIDRLVAKESHPPDAEPNLLSSDAPQE